MAQDQPQSTFVTVLAWIAIVLSGFSTLISILQNIMLHTVFRRAGFDQAVQAPPPPGTPPVVAFMLGHFQLFFLAFLLVSVLALISSIGLLKRRNWARLCFIGLMVLAVAWQLGGLALQFSMFPSMQQQFTAAGARGTPDMQPFVIAIAAIGALFALGLGVLFGWIAKRLLSPAIAAEFRR